MERPHKISKVASDIYGWAQENADLLNYHYRIHPSEKPILATYAIINLLSVLWLYNNPGVSTMLLQVVGISAYFYYVSQILKRARARAENYKSRAHI